MISNKMRETRRGRIIKMPKNLERLYREAKCSECTVVVTRMDFAKILGKFTKVKIQYECSSPPKTKKNSMKPSPNSNARLKSNENGMVLIQRNAYNQHPVKEALNSKKRKANNVGTPRPLNSVHKENSVTPSGTPKHKVNILKENNRLKKPLIAKKISNIHDKNILDKLYGIIFEKPTENKKDINNKFTLNELLPLIDKSVLPSDKWCIAYLPTGEEPKEDKVYDRIAAELEDLMCNEKSVKTNVAENKVDDFPSIMDILNESNAENISKTENHSNSTELKSNLESSDVEAMLLGKSNDNADESVSKPMEVVIQFPVDKLIADVINFETDPQKDTKLQDMSNNIDAVDNPNSPSILDEALQEGAEEHLPCVKSVDDSSVQQTSNEVEKTTIQNTSTDDGATPRNVEISKPIPNFSTITHAVFKKYIDGYVSKLVTCPKNLKYSIEIDGKSVEFLGAPKFISSLDDLQVLLQIVNDSELNSLYVMH